ncbi:MAG: hypothetical protein O2800_07020 [Planctomycetota bacterium]|nr:hypothetical protein [Planctomycetota bacterium]
MGLPRRCRLLFHGAICGDECQDNDHARDGGSLCAGVHREVERWMFFLLPEWRVHPCVGIWQGAFRFEETSTGTFVLGFWGLPNSNADIDGDGQVSGSDLALLLGSWGSCAP